LKCRFDGSFERQERAAELGQLGKGGVDFPGIKKILEENSWKGWWTVELDRTGTTAKESSIVARKYLESLGLTV
jgi:sugar phosphate isomerase/epimerase